MCTVHHYHMCTDVSFIGVFSILKCKTLVLKTTTSWTRASHFVAGARKEKVQKNAEFPFCGQTKVFRYEIVFRGIQPCFLHGGSEHLACFEPTKAARFLKTFEVHSVLGDQRKARFIKVSWTFSTFWHRRERKTTKCAFEIDFFTMCSTDLTCVNATI